MSDKSITTETVSIQPAALLANTPADSTIEQLNTQLAELGLALPIEPLLPNVSLATLIRWNAGGRRRMRYGTIVRYLRAAQVDIVTPQGQHELELGGPTLKRATGYGLNRCLIAGGPLATATIHTVTLNLRPLPAARRWLRFQAADLATAQQLATRLLQGVSALSALPFALLPGGQVTLMAELEGSPPVVEDQIQRAQQLAAGLVATTEVEADAWLLWQQLALERQQVAPLALDLSLPRSVLAYVCERAEEICRRYQFAPQFWGDFGASALHIHTLDHQLAAGETQQVQALLCELARRVGGSPATEFGWQACTPPPPGVDSLRFPATTPVPTSDTVRSRRSSNRQALLDELANQIGAAYVLHRRDDLACYLRDASIARAAGTPCAVALPGSTAEVAETLRLAHAYNVPVVTRGAGSGLAGGSTPTADALVLGINRMQRLRIDTEQARADVGAGVVTADLQEAAEARGLFYPPDPSSLRVSTIGGNIACNAGGPRCLKYGVTGDYVLALTAVLADGSIVRWGDGLSGQSPDAGLLHLLIGSEGTLAVITEATLRLTRMPSARRTTLAIFEQLGAACATVERIMADGIIPAGLELMDGSTIAVVDDYLKLGLPRDAEAMLLLLADGEPAEVVADSERLAILARQGGARSVQTARSVAEEAELWRARRAIAPALARLRPNRLGEDIVVPLPQIAHCVARIKEVEARHEQPIVVFGHAGDGNLHPNILFDARDPIQVERVWRAAEEIFQIALELGGTLSGEHGIGTLKRPFMEQALGAAGIALQREIKARFDPECRLNPGKVLP